MPMPLSPQIVIVDDEEYICDIVQDALADDGYDLVPFSRVNDALYYIENHHVDLVLTDYLLGERTGSDVLAAARQHHHDAIVIVMTAHPTVETAVNVLTRGAYDFLLKPFKLELLRATIARGLSHQQTFRENVHLRAQVDFLKAANSSAVDQIDDYLQRVLHSCQIELGAECARFVQIDPATGEIVKALSASGDCMDDLPADLLANIDAMSRGEAGPFITVTPEMKTDVPQATLCITRPVRIDEVLHGVIRLRIVNRFGRVTPGQLDVLTILANSAAAAMRNATLYRELRDSYLQTIRCLANAIEARDPYTAGHTERVTRLAEALAHHLGWSPERLDSLRKGCMLHDIGKIGIPDRVLNKSGRLTDEERSLMEQHPAVGHQIIASVPQLTGAIPYVIAHHERFDGTGYPERLRAEAIPEEGRLLAVVDTFDAIMSDRPYRRGATVAVAINELMTHSGSQFDPVLVTSFLDLLRQGGVDLEALYGRNLDLEVLASVPATITEPA